MTASFMWTAQPATAPAAYEGPPLQPGYPKAEQVSGLAGITKLAPSGEEYALTGDGRVLSWGSGASGRLGTGSSTTTGTPAYVRNLSSVKKLVSNNGTHYALDQLGRVWSWGAPRYGLLGTGSRTVASVPQRVRGLPAIVDLVADEYAGTAYALGRNGRVYAWGRPQACYWLGTPQRTTAWTPVKVRIKPKVRSIWTTSGTEFAVTRKGRVLSWGLPSESGLGFTDKCPRLPTLVRELSKVVAIHETDTGAVLARSSSGSVWSWGHATYGPGNVYGYATSTRWVKRPRKVAITGVTALYPIAGVGVFARLSSGQFRAWGSGMGQAAFDGQRLLGNGKRGGSATPVAIPELTGASRVIDWPYMGAAGIFPSGAIKAWGYGRNDGFGIGSNADILRPTALAWAAGLRAWGSDPSLIAATPAGLITWGSLGHTLPATRMTIPGFADAREIISGAGCYTFMVRRANGTVWRVWFEPLGGIPAYCPNRAV